MGLTGGYRLPRPQPLMKGGDIDEAAQRGKPTRKRGTRRCRVPLLRFVALPETADLVANLVMMPPMAPPRTVPIPVAEIAVMVAVVVPIGMVSVAVMMSVVVMMMVVVACRRWTAGDTW